MSDFKAKMHKIRLPLGLRPIRPRLGCLQRSPDLLAVFKGPTSLLRERGGEGGREWKRRGRGEGEESGPPNILA